MDRQHSTAIKGLRAHLNRLQALGDVGKREVPRVIQETTQLGRSEVIKIITDKNLVDTGFYRANWQVSFPNPVTGVISTNTAYAEVLEYGFSGVVQVPEHNVRPHTRKGKRVRGFRRKAHRRQMERKPNYVVRRAKIRIRRILIRKVSEAIERAERARQ